MYVSISPIYDPNAPNPRHFTFSFTNEFCATSLIIRFLAVWYNLRRWCDATPSPSGLLLPPSPTRGVGAVDDDAASSFPANRLFVSTCTSSMQCNEMKSDILSTGQCSMANDSCRPIYMYCVSSRRLNKPGMEGRIHIHAHARTISMRLCTSG